MLDAFSDSYVIFEEITHLDEAILPDQWTKTTATMLRYSSVLIK